MCEGKIYGRQCNSKTTKIWIYGERQTKKKKISRAQEKEIKKTEKFTRTKTRSGVTISHSRVFFLVHFPSPFFWDKDVEWVVQGDTGLMHELDVKGAPTTMLTCLHGLSQHLPRTQPPAIPPPPPSPSTDSFIRLNQPLTPHTSTWTPQSHPPQTASHTSTSLGHSRCLTTLPASPIPVLFRDFTPSGGRAKAEKKVREECVFHVSPAPFSAYKNDESKHQNKLT